MKLILLILVYFVSSTSTAFADWKSDAEKAIYDGRTNDAVSILRPLADEGNVEAAWILGLALERRMLTLSEEKQIERRDAILVQLHYWEVAAWGKHAQAALNLGLVYMGRYPHHRNGAEVKKDLDSARVYLELASKNGNEQAKELLVGWDDSKVWYCVGEVFPVTLNGISSVRDIFKATVKFHTYSHRMDWRKQAFECDYDFDSGMKICKNGEKTFGFDFALKKDATLSFYYLSGKPDLLTVANGSCESF